MNKNSFLVNDSDLDNSNIIKVVYTGSIRHVNNLGLLLDAAKMISNPNVKILIWGNGDEVDLIKQRIIDEKLFNVIYKGSVKKEYVPSIICRADINIMHNQDVPLCKYGLSLNKMFEYAAAGKPVLVDFGTADNPLIKFKAGVRTEDNLPKSVAKGIEIITNMTISEIQLMKQGANLCAAEYDFKTLSNHLIDLIESM